MNSHQVADFFSAILDAFPSDESQDPKSEIEAFVSSLRTGRRVSIDNVVKRLLPLTIVGLDTKEYDQLSETPAFLAAASRALEIGGTKAAFTAVDKLKTFVDEHPNMSKDSFFRAIAGDTLGTDKKVLVNRYVVALQDAQDRPQTFREILAVLKIDSAMKAADVKAIAKRLTGLNSPRTQAEAFRQIENEVRYFEDANARRAAADGKSAA
jgi:hypothetical protein